MDNREPLIEPTGLIELSKLPLDELVELDDETPLGQSLRRVQRQLTAGPTDSGISAFNSRI